MSRLIVAAVSGESKFTDIVFHLELFVSVSDAQSGAPISGLMPDHFRLCSPSGKVFDTTIAACNEADWPQSHGEHSGCYALGITIPRGDGKQKVEWVEGEFYPFGIQVRYTDEHNEVHAGQTVVRVQSLGK
jgi:hypothetical protein